MERREELRSDDRRLTRRQRVAGRRSEDRDGRRQARAARRTDPLRSPASRAEAPRTAAVFASSHVPEHLAGRGRYSLLKEVAALAAASPAAPVTLLVNPLSVLYMFPGTSWKAMPIPGKIPGVRSCAVQARFLVHYLRSRRFPVEVSEVRLAGDPLTATARGAHIAAMFEK